MTIGAESSKVIYNANGILTDFAIPFSIEDSDEVLVYTWDPATPDTDPVQIDEGTDDDEYQVLNVDAVLGLPGDTISFNTAPTTGLKVILIRILDVDQQVLSTTPNVAIAPATIEGTADKIVKVQQQQQEQIDRSLKLTFATSATPPKVPMPSAHKLLRWNEDETDLENVDPGDLAISLGDLTPVDINNPQPDDVLLFNGTSWVNQPSPSSTPDASDVTYTDTFSVGANDSQAAIDVAIQNAIDINNSFGPHLDGGPSKHQASEIDFNPGATGLSGTVQDAIIDVNTKVDAISGGASVSDTAYDATSWDGDTTTAPSKNAIRDKIEALAAASLSNPMTTGGDIIYGGASGTPTRLPNGSAEQYLASSGGTSAPTWKTVFAPVRTILTSTGSTVGYRFVISSGSATAGATYTNNGNTYTVIATVASATVLYCTQASAPQSSGTLTKSGGTGDSTITFSSSVAIAQFTPQSSPRAPVAIDVECVGGGGGGAGSGTATGTAATAGGVTAFMSASGIITCNGGGGGVADNANGTGGTATITGYSGSAIKGSDGQQGGAATGTNFVVPGGSGGGTRFGGAGRGDWTGAGKDAAANSGSGGGGGGGTASGNMKGGGGGSAGGWARAMISPTGPFYYCIGAAGSAGAAGTSGSAGGAGSAGRIEITEY